MPVMASNIVSTSQPLASQAGIRMLLKGGNAIDAAISSAIALTVVEPTMNGIGSDAFAIIWDNNQLIGINASGRAPSAWTPEYFSKYENMPMMGWDSVTVPGTVSAWFELSNRFGNLPFKTLFKPAINYARNGFIVSPITAGVWKMTKGMFKKFSGFKETFLREKKSPKAGTIFKNPAQANALEKIAKTKGKSFYNGDLAQKIVEKSKKMGGVLEMDDLKNHKVTWESPLSIGYRNVTLYELGPNSQGLAALIMLGILREWNIQKYDVDSAESIHIQLEAMKLAFTDVYKYLSDLKYMQIKPSDLINQKYLKKRSELIDPNSAQKYDFGIPKHGDTVYLATADENGMMVSYIQSNYLMFGSGIVISGISLQNRGSGFTLEKGHPNQVGPNKRPFHTIIPAFVMKDNEPLMSFGVMGGPMQPQGHVQMIIRIFDYKQNPQAAIDAPRWQVLGGLDVGVEKEFDQEVIKDLENKGHKINKLDSFRFGGAQIIYKLKDGYLGASDPRKDGQSIGF
ncbi:MAG: gamma-glutamyltransferase [Candidatus Lokiarchaeota archaeon]|nr:gamma-glutamyltransferase [Candidatus Lokiarchaeota archaeon]